MRNAQSACDIHMTTGGAAWHSPRMTHLELFGTLTSPYVRRVRILAHEFGIEPVWVDTSTEAGQAALRQLTPLWKVPAARIDGATVLDSAVICRTLLRLFGPGPLAPFDPEEVETQNLITVVDGALDSLINAFYLRKDGIDADQVAYVKKQHDRASAALAWVGARVHGPWLTPAQRLGLPEIALVTALEWMTFRHTYDVQQQPALAAFLEHHASRPSIKNTAPPTS